MLEIPAAQWPQPTGSLDSASTMLKPPAVHLDWQASLDHGLELADPSHVGAVRGQAYVTPGSWVRALRDAVGSPSRLRPGPVRRGRGPLGRAAVVGAICAGHAVSRCVTKRGDALMAAGRGVDRSPRPMAAKVRRSPGRSGRRPSGRTRRIPVATAGRGREAPPRSQR